MLNIPKFGRFVIYSLFLCTLLTSCSSVASRPADVPYDNEVSKFHEPETTGSIKSRDVRESSGLTASRCQENVLWTHNDSDDGPFIFALDPQGRNLGTWKVTGSENTDWEDIAAFKDTDGKCHLLIADTGNNYRKRSTLKIYRVEEPAVTEQTAETRRRNALATAPAESFSFSYEDGGQDAETLLVHPTTGQIYVVSKNITSAAGVYKLPPFQAKADQVARKVGHISVPAVPNGLLTGGEISPDGRRVAVCDYFGAYELTLPETAADFDEIWDARAIRFDIGRRAQGEAITYTADGNTLYATSEKRESPIFRVSRVTEE
ncbi:MAG: hypothetical protein KF855_18025 [Acidobacteria bacterium]|nr:hypothetical protein [Acidobacteriota bacterium]